MVQMGENFPLDDAAVTVMRENIADRLSQLHDLEAAADTALKEVMS